MTSNVHTHTATTTRQITRTVRVGYSPARSLSMALGGCLVSIATALKGGVDIRGVCPEAVLGILICAQVYEAHGIPLVLTSVRDGKHSEKSLHYVGSAWDMRLPSRYTADANTDRRIAAELKEMLGQQFDLVLESDHIHAEFDPR